MSRWYFGKRSLILKVAHMATICLRTLLKMKIFFLTRVISLNLAPIFSKVLKQIVDGDAARRSRSQSPRLGVGLWGLGPRSPKP